MDLRIDTETSEIFSTPIDGGRSLSGTRRIGTAITWTQPAGNYQATRAVPARVVELAQRAAMGEPARSVTVRTTSRGKRHSDYQTLTGPHGPQGVNTNAGGLPWRG